MRFLHNFPFVENRSLSYRPFDFLICAATHRHAHDTRIQSSAIPINRRSILNHIDAGLYSSHAPVAAKRAKDRWRHSKAARLFVTIAAITALTLAPMSTAMSASAVPLGAASSFAVLGAATVTNTGATTVTGDLGVSPGTAVTGFPPGQVLGGAIHAADGVAAAAQASSTAAYGLLAAQACDVTFAAPTDMAGMTLLPGTYCFNSSATNTGLLTLNGAGNANAVWLFRTGSTLITGSGSSVVPVNGGQNCNVFWQIGTSATLGTNTAMVGNVLALSSITANTGSSISGRVLAQTGAVTLDTNSVAVCALRVQAAPGLSKRFIPTQIISGGTSTLTITIANQNPFLIATTAPLTDTLPSNVFIAPVPNASTTCGGSVQVNATAGTNTVTLPTGATVGSNGTCTISVDVTALSPAVYVNTIPINGLQTTNGNNSAPAVANLLVGAAIVPVATSVPTMSLFVLSALGLLLGVLGYAAIGRRANLTR